MKLEGTLIFETDDRYQHADDIERNVSKVIDTCLLKEGINAHMLTWSARQHKGIAEQQTANNGSTSPAEIADEIIESEYICDYCTREGCPVQQDKEVAIFCTHFKGRQLRACR